MAFFSLKLLPRPQPFSPPWLHHSHFSSARKGICLSEKHTATILEGGTVYFLISGAPRSPVTQADTHFSLSHSGRAEVCCSEKLGRTLHTPPWSCQSWGSCSPATAYPSEPERAHYKCIAPFFNGSYWRIDLPSHLPEWNLFPTLYAAHAKWIHFVPPSLRQCPGCHRATQAIGSLEN